jgi:glutamate 5-kinase
MEEGGRCTWFHPLEEPLTARKQWIAGSVKPQGSLTVDAGAKRALAKGGSLLPAGVVAADGEFQKGDAVVVVDREGRPVGVGLSAYSAEDARRIIGRKSGDFEGLLGYRGPDEIIHRDDLVIEQ